VDMNNKFNKVFPFFSSFNYEFLLGNRLIDIFPNCFPFHSSNKKSKQDIKNYLQNLDNITIQVLSDSLSMIVVTNTSMKNQIAISIAHIHNNNNLVIKTIHHVVNIMSTETKLFAIIYGINQATHLSNMNQIVVITDSIHATKRIFNSSLHPYQ